MSLTLRIRPCTPSEVSRWEALRSKSRLTRSIPTTSSLLLVSHCYIIHIGNFDYKVSVDGELLIPDPVTALRNANYTRDDGNPYVWPKDIVPFRVYVGMKGKLEDGSDAPEDDFLARNGFKYGQLYGFATDMSETGPTGGVGRDEWHKTATNGAEVVGKMIAQPWRWDGEVRNSGLWRRWHGKL